MASFLFIVALWLLYKAFKVLRRRRALAVSFYVLAGLAGLVGVIVTVWLVANAESILSALGRDITLSGRTVLWSALLDNVRERPWLGYGYGAFWTGGTGASARVYNQLLNTGYGPHVSADNGILDLWLSLGLLGVLVFACGFVRVFLRAVRWVRLTKTIEGHWPLAYLVFLEEGLWPLAYLGFFLVYNLVESSILTYNTILWLLYVEASLSIAVLAGLAGGLTRPNKPGGGQDKGVAKELVTDEP